MTDRRSTATLATLITALALASCGGKEDGDADTTTASVQTQAQTTPATAPAGKPAADGCTGGKPKLKPDVAFERPEGKLDPEKTWTVRMLTSCGPIAIRLDVKTAPKTASSVGFLVREKFYDGLTFHRVASSPTGDDFVIQAGDPLGTGEGGPGYTVTEAPPKDVRYTRGVVAMAKTEIDPPGASGSQFYIVTGEDAGLPPDYAVVGEITGSSAAIKRIAGVATDPPGDGVPAQPVVIERATLSGR